MITKIRPGLYQTDVQCKCGGMIRVERCGSKDFLWESFCPECKICDPNGWPTSKQAVQEAPHYFAKVKA